MLRKKVVSMLVAGGLLALLFLVFVAQTQAQAAKGLNRDFVKVAAVQICGYDKGDLPREGYDPTTAIVPYIDRAGKDGAQLVVFPEYILGHIQAPGPTTEKISAAAAANKIYVIIGCWEDFADGQFANTALIFDRSGKIVGKYNKTHAAVDNYEKRPGVEPWTQPPSDKDRAWLLKHDPEWIMRKGQNLPVFDLDFGKVGVLTCYDGWFPEPARVMSLKGAELLVWINGRGGLVEDFIVKSTMFREHVAMITTNQAYGGGTMIGDCAKWPVQILAQAPANKESYITATVNLQSVRKTQAESRNLRQRRPELYGEIVKPIK